MQLLQFIKGYLDDPRAVGSIIPSSRGLADAVTKAAGVRDARTIVEFGPGTGVFTSVIQQSLNDEAVFLAIEIRKDFVEVVRERCPGVHVFHDSAANVQQCLEAVGRQKCDCIISGLPFALFDDELQDQLLDASYEALEPGGVFVTFTYIFAQHLPKGEKFYERLRERFVSVDKTRTVWTNVFPAFAYRALK
ncbi:MAG: methyltransferase domain-containing protein [Nitrospiraceae bacterium]|nr:methyltransferase domain-containing protein [Nitrospiraceae bacterium]